MSRIHFHYFTLLATAVLISVSGCARVSYQHETPASESDFIVSAGREIPVTIPLDELGVLLRKDAGEKAVDTLEQSLKARLRKRYPGNILVFSLDRPMTRNGLGKLARSLVDKHPETISHAGLVVIPDDAEAPMILTDELVVQFLPGTDKEQIARLFAAHGTQLVRRSPFVQTRYLLRVTEESGLDPFEVSRRFRQSGWIRFAHPNFIQVTIDRETIPNDTLFGDQWHHRNTGQGAGTVDADIDTSHAWDFTTGDAAVLIAVIDSGTDATHPDLTPNLWTNPGEIADNDVDEDGNTYVDDIHGWDFYDDDADLDDGYHGAGTAGCAAARGNNLLGVSGSCPNCSLMLILRGSTSADHADAIDYARSMGADIITNSWGYAIGTPTTTVVETAIDDATTLGRGGQGSLVLFAMTNTDENNCSGTSPDISSIDKVIAVSRATNQDTFDPGGWGDCMDLLGPTRGGTLGIVTTDVQGAGGADPGDYNMNFGGTSASTPIIAGVVGLIMDLRPALTRLQIQRLLQDTTDKVEDSAADYRLADGFSKPGGGDSTHGYGRINGFEAARIVAPAAEGGTAGVDLFMRDNRLDWGNTEQPSNTLFDATRGYIGHWRSVDIKIDASPYAAAPTAATFDGFADEVPSATAGAVNRVYVRVRNRGPDTAESVTVKLHWTQFGTALPTLPADFWTAFPADSADTSQWHPLECTGTGSNICTLSDLAYSGNSVAGTAADAAQIVQFDFPAPVIDPLLANHFCLLAMADSVQDPISADSRSKFIPDTITPNDNNVTHRNYHDLRSDDRDSFSGRFYVRNPTKEIMRAVLRLQAPQRWKVALDRFGFDQPFELHPGEEALVTLRLALSAHGERGEVTIVQEWIDGDEFRPLGAVSYRFHPEMPVSTGGDAGAYMVGTFDLRNGAQTLYHIVNPTTKNLRLLVTFFDDEQRPLTCLHERMSPNDLLEIDATKLKLDAHLGVVKVVALHEQHNLPEIGVVGNQRIMLTGADPSEMALHLIQPELLDTELGKIFSICR